jgi:Restriction endonuclease NaeI
MDKSHVDYASLEPLHAEISRLSGGAQALALAFPTIVSDAVDFVVDPVRTARTKVSDLDNVEKTFIGLKVEHYLRDFLNVPKGLRDLRIAGMDVDVKNTVSKTWMIPPETFKNVEPCILIMVATEDRHCSMGLMIARPEYLNAPNRDAKRSVSSKAFENIYWMVKQQPLPESRFNGIDMARFRQLRSMRGGAKRAAAFFRENTGRIIHRTVVQGLLFDQDDYMKRIRSNGGAKDLLSRENIAILSGAYARNAICAFGLPPCGKDEFVSWQFDDNGRRMLLQMGYFNKKT